MSKRHVYALLFGVPGFFLALIMSLLIFGSAAGALWLYCFGDNPWPDASAPLLTILVATSFLALWAAMVVIGYLTGKRLEATPGLNRRHVMISAILTIAPILLLAAHQWSVGNLGSPSDVLICRDLCARMGYPASGMPRDSGEKICICYDAGREVWRLPLDDRTPGQ